MGTLASPMLFMNPPTLAVSSLLWACPELCLGTLMGEEVPGQGLVCTQSSVSWLFYLM